MFLVLKWPKKLLQERYPNIEHVDSLSFVIGMLAVFLEKLGYSWNLAVFGTGAINGWDKVKITHWDNSITAL